MLKTILVVLFPLLMLFGNGWESTSVLGPVNPSPDDSTGTLEKMIVANGRVTLTIDLGKLSSKRTAKQSGNLQFDVEQNSFFTVLVFNNEFRGPEPSSMNLLPQNATLMPGKLGTGYQQLILENLPWGSDRELVIRDSKTGFTYFEIEGHQYQFDAGSHL